MTKLVQTWSCLEPWTILHFLFCGILHSFLLKSHQTTPLNSEFNKAHHKRRKTHFSNCNSDEIAPFTENVFELLPTQQQFEAGRGIQHNF